MAWLPVAKHVPQYVDQDGHPLSGGVLHYYAAGSTQLIQIATDVTGNTLVEDVMLNSLGYPTVSGQVIIPYVDQDHKVVLYPTLAAARSATGAIYTIDHIPFESFVWEAYEAVPSYVSASAFSVPGEHTRTFHEIRRVRLIDAAGVKYASVINSSFAHGKTTVNVSLDDNGVLSPPLQAVALSVISVEGKALPNIQSYVRAAQQAATQANTTQQEINTKLAQLDRVVRVVLRNDKEPTTEAAADTLVVRDQNKQFAVDSIRFTAPDRAIGVGGGALAWRHNNTTSPTLEWLDKRKLTDWLGLLPVGTVLMWPAATVPEKYLPCHGQYISKITYSRLYLVLGDTLGANATQFRILDLRGVFVRGRDSGRGLDQARSHGHYQADAFKSHSHTLYWAQSSGGRHPRRRGNSLQQYTGKPVEIAVSSAGGNETRPKNVAIDFIIRY